jgi:PAS domain S-box-containing protein
MSSLPAEWKQTIDTFTVDTNAVALGVLSLPGEMIWTNHGMQVLLGMDQGNADPLLWLVNPTFENLVNRAVEDGLIFSGLLTAGDGKHLSRSVTASVFHQHGQLLICAAYDVLQLDQQNRQMAAVNSHANNLQRQLLKEKLTLERAMADIRTSEARYRRLFESAILGIFQSTDEGRLLQANPEFARIFGYDTPETLLKGDIHIGQDLYVDPVKFKEIVSEISQGRKPVKIENRYRRKDGSTFTGSLHKWPVVGDRGELLHMEGFIEDIDERKRMEAQMLQARKMEAIGVLAGGIAHEFNNALSGMMGYLDLLSMSVEENPEAERYCQRMLRLSQRMALHAKQLLAYAKGGKYRPKNQHLSSLIQQETEEISKQRPAGIDIHLDLSPTCATVVIDETQMGMVLRILLENAVEALSTRPGGGTIRIGLDMRVVDEATAARYASLKPGRYVCLRMADNGPGMSKAVAERVFEPFFTTKFQGRGMGMAATYGIVKNHGGWIFVDTQEAKGTTIEIFLPPAETVAKSP